MSRRDTNECEPVLSIPGSEDQLVGRRFLSVLDNMLDSLHTHCDHPNRKLFYDDIVVAHLLAFFNPALRGLRSIEELFEDPKVRRAFRSPRVPKSTLADAQRLFDPALLIPLIQSLQHRLGTMPLAAQKGLDELSRKLVAVDGSFFAVAPRIAWALYNQSAKIRKGNVRLHMHFDILRGLPDQVGLTDGHYSESQHLRERLEPGCFYVMDRGFQAYQLLADIIAIESDFLVRLRKSAACREIEPRRLTVADQAVGIDSDTIVDMGWRDDQTATLPPLRRIVIRTVDRDGVAGDVILLTNRFDLPAHLVALIYQHRWQVELFFRWLKCMANFEHFFSESREGMTLQVYVTIIGTLLIALHVGSQPSKYDYALMSSAVLGWTSIEHVRRMAAKRLAAKEKAAERRAARSAQKNND